MVRLIALFRQPADRAAFDDHYRDVHTPLVRQYPGLRDLKVTRLGGLAGRDPAYYQMAEMAFDSRADLDAALASEPGRESGRDLRAFADAGVDLVVADDDATVDG
ncbi:MAG TPA: EthD family reductase [Candidatus Limnocylindria bacterium]|nr:EthD family reductase [Candidatus Limnocylindria bacterium]